MKKGQLKLKKKYLIQRKLIILRIKTSSIK